MVIIFRDLGSKLIVLGIKGALQKSKKKSHPKGKAFISIAFFQKCLRLLRRFFTCLKLMCDRKNP